MADGDAAGGHVHPEIWVYALVNPGDALAAESIVRRLIFSVLGVSDAARHVVRVSPSTGWITYRDREALWRPRPAVRLPDETQTRQRCDDFLRQLGAAFASAAEELTRLADRLEGAVWLPQARPLELKAVPRPDGTTFEHWLYRLQPTLPGPRGERPVPVFGGQLELRLDEGGRVISFTSCWRPILPRRMTVELRHPPVVHAHDGERRKMPPPQLCYLLEGELVPQLYLAPYYLVNTGHVIAVAGASAMSLTIDFVVKEDDGETKVHGVVTGSSGHCRFTWAYAPFDEVAAELTEIENPEARTFETEGGVLVTSTIDLPHGNWIVMVNALDLKTGAFKHYREQVSTAPRGIPDRPGAPLVA